MKLRDEKTREVLLEELEALRRRVRELESEIADPDPGAEIFRTLFSSIGHGILVVEISTKKFVLANQVICEMLGYTENELLEMSVFDIHPQDDMDHVLSVFEAQARGEIELGRNIPCLGKDGRVIYADIRTRKVPLDGVECNVGFFTDISERKRQEDETHAREDRIRRHQSAIVRLLSNSAVLEGDFREALRLTTEIAAETMETERVGVWLLSGDGRELICEEQYERGPRKHSEGTVFQAANFPRYFQAIREVRAINADDARNDARTSEFNKKYHIPLGITSTLEAGIRVHGELAGVVSFEHTGEPRKWKPEEMTFAGEIADQVAKATIAREKADALQALSERETQITGILRAAPVGIGLVKDRVFVWVSDRAQEMTGYASGEMIGKSARMLYESDEEFNRVGDVKYGRMREAGIGAIDTRWVRKDGEIIEINLSSTPINPGDHSEGVIFSALDIGDRKKAETKLRESETKFRALTENTSDITVIVDESGLYSYISPAVEKVFKYKPEEVLGMPLGDFIHPDDWAGVSQVLSEAVENPYLSIMAPLFRVKRSDGEWRILEGIATYMPDVPEVKGIVTNCRDVTERREMEQALEASERFLANVFDSIQDGISVLDRDFMIMRTNHVMREWYKDFLPLEGSKCYEQYHDRSEPCEVCPTRRCFETGKTERDVVPGPAGSQVKWIELYSFPFRDPETGEVAGAVEYVRDITEKKEAENIIEQYREHLEELVEERTRELKKAQEQLIASERLSVLGQFAGSVAHEIRNPLGVISNSAYYLKMVAPKDNPKIDRHLEIIANQ